MIKEHPTIETKRLILRPYKLDDAPVLQCLINDRDIAATAINIPYPYKDGMAEKWIKERYKLVKQGKSVDFAIVHRVQNTFIGSIGLVFDVHNECAEIGYWIGKSYWTQGYCTEAAQAVLRYVFKTLRLHRIRARHMSRNHASGRVIQKIGMKHEGHLRQDVKKWDKFEDVEVYGILREEYENKQCAFRNKLI